MCHLFAPLHNTTTRARWHVCCLAALHTFNQAIRTSVVSTVEQSSPRVAAGLSVEGRAPCVRCRDAHGAKGNTDVCCLRRALPQPGLPRRTTITADKDCAVSQAEPVLQVLEVAASALPPRQGTAAHQVYLGAPRRLRASPEGHQQAPAARRHAREQDSRCTWACAGSKPSPRRRCRPRCGAHQRGTHVGTQRHRAAGSLEAPSPHAFPGCLSRSGPGQWYWGWCRRWCL